MLKEKLRALADPFAMNSDESDFEEEEEWITGHHTSSAVFSDSSIVVEHAGIRLTPTIVATIPCEVWSADSNLNEIKVSPIAGTGESERKLATFTYTRNKAQDWTKHSATNDKTRFHIVTMDFGRSNTRRRTSSTRTVTTESDGIVATQSGSVIDAGANRSNSDLAPAPPGTRLVEVCLPPAKTDAARSEALKRAASGESSEFHSKKMPVRFFMEITVPKFYDDEHARNLVEEYLLSFESSDADESEEESESKASDEAEEASLE